MAIKTFFLLFLQIIGAKDKQKYGNICSTSVERIVEEKLHEMLHTARASVMDSKIF